MLRLKENICVRNDDPIMVKALRKAMMYCRTLSNEYIKRRTGGTLEAFKAGRCCCMKLLRKTKSNC